MRIAMLAAAISAGTAAIAEDWHPMSGPDIAAVLTDRVVAYENAVQTFFASGRTLYNAGSDSWGYWEVRGDQYCSQWPPSDLWACYDMQISGETVRFLGISGEATDGHLTGSVPAN